MKRIITTIVAICLIFSLITLAEETVNNWKIDYYVDEFRIPTNKPYMHNAEIIEGLFSNSATRDSLLNVSCVLDVDGLAFMLYEYGTNLVCNVYSDACEYRIVMRDSNGDKTNLVGWMNAGSNRIRVYYYIDEELHLSTPVMLNSSNPIFAAFAEGTVSFYIEEYSNPTTNYLFTIPNTIDFGKNLIELQNMLYSSDYNAAVSLFEEGNYQDALSIFEGLGDYRDSTEWGSKYWDILCAESEKLLASNKYDEAKAVFINAEKYGDVEAYIKTICYAQGEDLLADNNYEGAIDAFTEADDYSDAKQRISEAYYQWAEESMKLGDYTLARKEYSNAGDYRDARDRLGETYWNEAKLLMDTGKYEDARQVLKNSIDYKDAKARICEVYYSEAEALLEAQEFDAANDAFILAGDFKDAKSRVGEPYYLRAETYLAAGEDMKALLYLRKAKGYGSSDELVKILEEQVSANMNRIAASDELSLGLRTNGTVIATAKKKNIKNGAHNVKSWKGIIAVSAGTYHSLGLRADGRVVSTKYESLYGNGSQCKVSKWRNIVSISAGSEYSLGLRNDGTVIATGNTGACDVAGWKNIVAISAGRTHSLGLRIDGTVVAAGNNDMNKCDVADWTDIVAISAGSNYSLGLRSDGTVIATEWGFDVSNWTDIVAISAGTHHCLGLRADGTVVVAYDGYFQDYSYGAIDVGGWNNIIAIKAADEHSLALREDGTVLAIGRNQRGECEVSGWNLSNSK